MLKKIVTGKCWVSYITQLSDLGNLLSFFKLIFYEVRKIIGHIYFPIVIIRWYYRGHSNIANTVNTLWLLLYMDWTAHLSIHVITKAASTWIDTKENIYLKKEWNGEFVVTGNIQVETWLLFTKGVKYSRIFSKFLFLSLQTDNRMLRYCMKFSIKVSSHHDIMYWVSYRSSKIQRETQTSESKRCRIAFPALLFYYLLCHRALDWLHYHSLWQGSHVPPNN